MGKLSFNLAGAKETMAQAQEKVKAEVAVAAVRARRLNTRDAATQTVRDPESQDQDGGSVTIWRLRPRGMDNVKHLPRKVKKKAVAADTEEVGTVGGTTRSSGAPSKPQKGSRKRARSSGGPSVGSAAAGDAAEAPQAEVDTHAPALTDSYGGCATLEPGADVFV